jgi:hypothetical protein
MKKENNNGVFRVGKSIVYGESVREVAKLDCDGVVRLYNLWSVDEEVLKDGN